MQGSQAELLVPLYDAREVRENRARFRREALPLLERANSFYCPLGRYPSRGWILLSRRDLNLLNKYSLNLQLEVGDPTAPGNVAALKRLSIVQAQCVSRGLASDPAALYLVEITDRRGLLDNRWFTFPLTSAYNIRAPGYPHTDRGGTFYPSTMNGGTTYTWSALVSDIWTQMSTFIGSFPGLPITPESTPEGMWFPGVPAWSALNDVLEHLGMTVAVNHQHATTPYTIILNGATDLTLAAMQAFYRPALEDDLEWMDFGVGRLPFTVKVLFKRRYDVYGTEETTPYKNDVVAQQWATTMGYAVSVTVADLGYTQFASASGTHYIWSDFTVRYDWNNTVNANDAAYAAIIARQRAQEYFGKIDPTQYLDQTYIGARPFVTGSRVDGVCWYQDYRSGRAGWRTQIVHGPQPPWPDIWRDK